MTVDGIAADVMQFPCGYCMSEILVLFYGVCEVLPCSRGEVKFVVVERFAVAYGHGCVPVFHAGDLDAVRLSVALAAFPPQRVRNFRAAHFLLFLRSVVDEVPGRGFVQAGVPDAAERLGVPLDLTGFV